MPCPSCIAVPIALIGFGGVITTYHIIVCLLLTIFSLCLYLHYKEFKNCESCHS